MGPCGDAFIAPEARSWLDATSCQNVFKVLGEDDLARAVGGSVRNALIGTPVADVDIATVHMPDDVMARAASAGLGVHPTGIEHGTVTVVSDGVPYEVTTLRQDVSTDGRRATVAFTGNWSEDASRRDFTINALYCDRHGRLFDPLGGLADLEARQVRFIGAAEDRIREDYLRILRFFRFHASYGHGLPDDAGLAACRRELSGIKGLSAERVRDELLKLLVADGALTSLEAMTDIGLDACLFDQAFDIARWKRLCAIEQAAGVVPDAVMRLAASLVKEKDDATAVAEQLKLSNSQAGALEVAGAALGGKYDFEASDPQAARRLIYGLGRENFDLVILFLWLRAGSSSANDAWAALWTQSREWDVPAMPFKGRDVMALGVPAGPDVGAVLKAFEAWWSEAGFPSDPILLQKKLLEFRAAHSSGH